MHTPVLLQTVLQNLDIKPKTKYIDATLGEGGYAKALVARRAKVLALDWDDGQINRLQKAGILKKVKMINGNFSEIERIAKEHDFNEVDGVIFDLGLSVRQLSCGKRGFSYKQLADPLDMRINRQSKKTAADLLSRLPENDLYDLFSRFSEEINSKIIAQAIVANRRQRQLAVVGDLVDIIDNTLSRHDETVLARIFQALRIAVNREFDNLINGLTQAYRLLKPKGKIAVISFHSLEDRLVKRLIRQQRWRELKTRVIGNHLRRRFERSAKLRIIIKPT